MKRLVTIEGIERGRINAMKDHPKVRRIEGDLYGVTCKRRCVRGAEHQVQFELRGDQLWSECIDCESERWRANRSQFDLCRHVAAALALYLYYREQESSASTREAKAA